MIYHFIRRDLAIRFKQKSRIVAQLWWIWVISKPLPILLCRAWIASHDFFCTVLALMSGKSLRTILLGQECAESTLR